MKLVEFEIQSACYNISITDVINVCECSTHYEPWRGFLRILSTGSRYHDVDTRVHNVINVDVMYQVSRQLAEPL